MNSVDWPTKDLLSSRAASTPDRTALIDAETGNRWTYRELDRQASRVAARLEQFVSDTGDVVGILMNNRVAFVELVHAAMRTAATLVPFNVRLTADELRAQATSADLTVLVCEHSTADLAGEIGRCPVISVDESSVDSVSSFDSLPSVESVSEVGSPHPIQHGQTGVIMFTSGTTGIPKGVKLTYGNLIASANASAFRLGTDPDDRWLVCLPMYHMGGLAPIYRSVLSGTTVVLQKSFDAGKTAHSMGEHEITGVSLVPTMLSRLLESEWEPPEHLRFVLLGGAPASQGLIEECERRGVPVHPSYGMTETASQVATARPAEAFEHPGTVGQPLVCTTVRRQDGDGNWCEPGEPGELVVSGPTVSPGYLDDTHTDAAFDEYGFHTGDVGYVDTDGRLWIVGRLDDQIITGGENVHPSEVVAVLGEHSGVRDATVVGVPDPEWGKRVGALIVPREGHSLDTAAIRDHCKGQLAGYKRPRVIGFVDELPRTASGTVDRTAVRERLLALRD